MVIVEDDINKSRTANTCMNWNLTWHHSLSKELGAEYMTEHCGVLNLQKNQLRLVFNKLISEDGEIRQVQLIDLH